ncbi:MAG: hypothetical protein KDK39_14625 [Leptospiraceae bacterium]|nr:hypothetical protein [Leptospiraceae bacterium]
MKASLRTGPNLIRLIWPERVLIAFLIPDRQAVSGRLISYASKYADT